MSKVSFYEDTVRLEGDIKHFYHTLCHKKQKAAKVVSHYQNRHQKRQAHLDLAINTVANLSILASLTFWLT